jgi:hypothetical protein
MEALKSRTTKVKNGMGLLQLLPLLTAMIMMAAIVMAMATEHPLLRNPTVDHP